MIRCARVGGLQLLGGTVGEVILVHCWTVWWRGERESKRRLIGFCSSGNVQRPGLPLFLSPPSLGQTRPSSGATGAGLTPSFAGDGLEGCWSNEVPRKNGGPVEWKAPAVIGPRPACLSRAPTGGAERLWEPVQPAGAELAGAGTGRGPGESLVAAK